MFYKLLAGGVLATFGAVFWLSGPSAPSAPAAPAAPAEPEGHLIAMPVADVYAAIKDMKRGEFKLPSEVAQVIGGPDVMDSVRPERVPNESITWHAKQGKHRAIDITVRLRPSADSQGTLINLDYVKHPLPKGDRAGRVEHLQKVAYLRFGQMLSDELKEIDPDFAKKVRKDANRPLMAEGYMTAARVAANPIAVMKQARTMENEIRAMGAEAEKSRREAAERAAYADAHKGVSFRPGQPMVDPSRPAN